jgi:hypothetical protein
MFFFTCKDRTPTRPTGHCGVNGRGIVKYLFYAIALSDMDEKLITHQAIGSSLKIVLIDSICSLFFNDPRLFGCSLILYLLFVL